MDITSGWITDIVDSLSILNIQNNWIAHSKLHILSLNNDKLLLNLIPLQNSLSVEQCISAQDNYQQDGILLIQLWEDTWFSRKQQVLSRLMSLLGENGGIHGRKTQLSTLDQKSVDDFLNQHHIQGSAKARYRFGLVYEGELVAVATFSGTRLMKYKRPGYRSAELIRFASKSGITVTGGFTKLLKYFLTLVKPDDLMSYADRDWSDGKGYESSGFILEQIQEPAVLFVHKHTLKRYFSHRLPEGSQTSDFIQIFNTGNLKFILYL